MTGSDAWAQVQPNENAQKVRIETVDGVELSGSWFPGTKKNAPVVMVLHALGNDDSSKAEWRNLAKTLQKQGFAVLLFDFRGHGGSTNIGDPQTFWAYNRALTSKKMPGNTIEFKDYVPGAYTYFVNDIAAAKVFLDQKNDAGECNSSALVLIGADTGATLGALWMKSEFYRFRYIKPEPPITFVGAPDLKNPAGNNVMAAIFLSISPKLGSLTLNIPVLLKRSVLLNAIPTVFMYNTKSKSETEMAEACDKLKIKNDKRFDYTGKFPLNMPAENLTGRELLSDETNTAIGKWLDTLTQAAKGNNWSPIELNRNFYIWYFGPNTFHNATATGGKNFNFYDYSKFLNLP
jgi:hypothetical protein